ncbi:helix-turn-helix transcriptional regulator [Bacillus infantis]|uniref:helix-turn-helix domain-containing protein n=1 Tax=Bacillus infantis TaxID=324767 RepID=UPI002FBE6402
MNLKSKIGELAKQSGLRKSFIAEKLKISGQQYRNYETGRSLIPIDKAFELAKILGVKVDDLYEDIDSD